jgi:hypothetical protein
MLRFHGGLLGVIGVLFVPRVRLSNCLHVHWRMKNESIILLGSVLQPESFFLGVSLTLGLR